MTKTNINLIVNGTKAYTRKTTGRPYTHALVMHRDGKWSIMSCSSKGPAPLQSIINGAAEYRNYLAARIANEPGSVYVDSWRSSVAFADAAEYRIVAIIDNTITVNA